MGVIGGIVRPTFEPVIPTSHTYACASDRVGYRNVPLLKKVAPIILTGSERLQTTNIYYKVARFQVAHDTLCVGMDDRISCQHVVCLSVSISSCPRHVSTLGDVTRNVILNVIMQYSIE